MTLHQVLVILRARWLFATYMFFGLIVAVLAVSLIWPKQYLAVASVVVDNKTDPVAAGANAAAAGQPATKAMKKGADNNTNKRKIEKKKKFI